MNLPAPPRASTAALAAAGALAVANLIRPVVPGGVWHVATTAALLGVGHWARLTSAELGLARDRVPAGLRLGGLVFAGISAVVVAGGLLGVLQDDRVDIGAGEVALRVLVLIPLGTVLVEELAFRGVLQGLLDRATTRRGSLVIASVLFGLWHVVPAATGGGVGDGDVAVPLLAVGTFLATTVAGAGFWWLRDRTGSLVAPMLAHLATNSVTFAVAWAAAQT